MPTDKKLDLDDSLFMMPARKIKSLLTDKSPVTITDTGEISSRYAILSTYWRDGLHNIEGIALARDLNAAIQKHGLSEKKEAILRLMEIYPNSRRLGLSIVSEEVYQSDPHLKTNQAEPVSLLSGKFVRDEEGAYRPASGGRAVVVDKGDSLILKNKSNEGYVAAMELAISKGWSAIELKGKPAMLSDAWLEAKFRGLEVVNYSPTKEDLIKYQERLSKESATLAPSQLVEQEEQVEVKPFVNAQGQNKVTSVTYTISGQQTPEVQFTDPQKAADFFATVPANDLPVVIRSIARVDGVAEPEHIIAGVDNENGMLNKSVDSALDHEFAEAFQTIAEIEKNQSSLIPNVVTNGFYSGEILLVTGDRVVQKTGRNSTDIVIHDLNNLSKRPRKNEVEEIAYNNEGIGIVKEIKREISIG